MNSKKKNNSEMLLTIILLSLAGICGLIWTFTNVGIDETYQISMAYRYIKGDIPFIEMWEPHQTSSFINIALEWIYLKIAGTTTGIVLYLQLIGIIIRAAIAYVLFRTLKDVVPKAPAFCVALLFFMLSPKDYAIPEYGNMQVWFGALIVCLLIKHLSNPRVVYIVAIAILTCCSVFSYPSCVLLYIPVVALLGIYCKRTRVRDISVYTLCCTAIGVTFLLVLIGRFGFDKLWECLIGMLSLEPSHTVSVQSRLVRYGTNLLTVFASILAVCAVSLGIVLIVNKFIAKKKECLPKASLRYLFYAVCMLLFDVAFFFNIISAENRCAYGIIFVFVIAVGLHEGKQLVGKEKIVYVMGTAISLTGLLATLILTDLPFVVSMAYAVVAIGMATIPICANVSFESSISIKKILLASGVTFIVLLAFRAAYIRTPIVGRGQIVPTSLNNISIVRVGPAKGIITDDESSVRERDGFADFAKYIGPNDKVMVIDGLVNSLAYLYTDAEIAVPSVMSDPKYSANMLEYFRICPQKEPNVLAVAAYNGEMDYDVSSNPWAYRWITEEFGATRVEEGTYWLFFYK